MKFKELREKYRSKFPASLVAAAVKIALDMGGAMTPAVKKIEAMKRGLSDDPIVKDALRQANESVKEGKKLKPADQEKLAGMFNSLMGVKHGSPEFKKIKAEIQKVLGEGTDTILEIKNKNKELANIKKIIKQLDKVGRDVNNLEGRNLDDDDVNYLMGYLSDAEDVAKEYLQTVQKY